jgi:cytochrome c peroxidase
MRMHRGLVKAGMLIWLVGAGCQTSQSSKQSVTEMDAPPAPDDSIAQADMMPLPAEQPPTPEQPPHTAPSTPPAPGSPAPDMTQGGSRAAEEPASGTMDGGTPSSDPIEPGMSGCPSKDPPVTREVPTTMPDLGQRLFDDQSLSASCVQSCASCHDSARAFTGNNDPEHPLFPVARGAFPSLLGERNAPTAMYAQFSPAFGFVDDGGEWTPTGGQFWDGRVDTLAQQAGMPFLNPREMALPDKAAVIARVRMADYAPAFSALFGVGALDDVDAAYDHVTQAIAAFERTEAFSPFSSKFDAVLQGKAEFSEPEALGFALFKDDEKGNCIACHAGDPESQDPHDWLFTDFTYDNLGVPRESEIPDNADRAHYDLGLCQSKVVVDRVPESVTDKQAFVASLCGAFKVPTLRNIAKTAPYMHNGHFKQLRDVVNFYVTRDTNPERWYPQADDGSVLKFDDLPAAYQDNVNTSEVPYDRKPGEQPRLCPTEIDALVAFLRTLSDGYESTASQ